MKVFKFIYGFCFGMVAMAGVAMITSVCFYPHHPGSQLVEIGEQFAVFLWWFTTINLFGGTLLFLLARAVECLFFSKWDDNG